MSYKRTFHTVDTHSGVPMRVITGGIPNIPGNTVYEQMRWLEENDDQIRNLMIKEPRGYPPYCCDIIVPPKNPKADAGYIILEQNEYPIMSGSNTIAVTTVLLETGMLEMIEPLTELTLESPGGLINVKAECSNGKVTNVTFQNIPAFVKYLDTEIDVPHLGKVTVDVAWGGMWFVIADVRQFKGLELTPKHGAEIARISAMIRQAAQEQLPIEHPDYPETVFSVTQLSGPSDNPEADWKNVVTLSSGDVDWDNPSTWTAAIDRSPCGTGNCAKMATLHAKGELNLNQDFRLEGILGTIYTGRLIEEVSVGKNKGVIPTIRGEAWITGFNTYVLDSSDPFPNGFTIGDIWAMGK